MLDQHWEEYSYPFVVPMKDLNESNARLVDASIPISFQFTQLPNEYGKHKFRLEVQFSSNKVEQEIEVNLDPTVEVYYE